jgi:hypothetical protein
MRRYSNPPTALFAALVALSSSCGATTGTGQPGTGGPGPTTPTTPSTPSTPSPPPDFLPDLPNTWFDAANLQHTFNFQADTQRPKGAFDVGEAAGTSFFQGQGMLSGADVTFTVDHGDLAPWQFTGKFTDHGTMQLTVTPSDGSPIHQLTIKRGETIAGSVVDQAAQPAALLTADVIADFDHSATTDRNTFRADNVPPFAYSMVAHVDAGAGTTLVLGYDGVSRADPTLVTLQATNASASGPALNPVHDPTAAPGSEFSWDAVTGAIYVVLVRPHVQPGATVWQLVTAATHAGIPQNDFITLEAGTTYEWWVQAFGPFDGIDAAAGSTAGSVFAKPPLARSATLLFTF